MPNNFETITLGDGTIVKFTIDPNGKVITITSENPIFVFLVSPYMSVDVGTFTTNVINTIYDLIRILYEVTGFKHLPI